MHQITLFQDKKSKNFLRRRHNPLPDPTPIGEGDTPPTPPPRRLRRLDPCAYGAWYPPPPFENPGSATEFYVLRLAPHDHETATLRHLHWLPVQYRIILNSVYLCNMHLIHIHKAPSYLTDIVTQTASVSSRGRLRSASSSRYEQPRMRLKFGQRCFSCCTSRLEHSTAITATTH